MTEPITVDAAGAGTLLGISERLVGTLTAEGILPTIDLGDHRNRLYSVEALRRWALERSGYTRAEEAHHDEATDRPTATIPAEGREVATRGPGRPGKSRASGETLPLRVVEG